MDRGELRLRDAGDHGGIGSMLAAISAGARARRVDRDALERTPASRPSASARRSPPARWRKRNPRAPPPARAIEIGVAAPHRGRADGEMVAGAVQEAADHQVPLAERQADLAAAAADGERGAAPRRRGEGEEVATRSGGGQGAGGRSVSSWMVNAAPCAILVLHHHRPGADPVLQPRLIGPASRAQQRPIATDAGGAMPHHDGESRTAPRRHQAVVALGKLAQAKARSACSAGHGLGHHRHCAGGRGRPRSGSGGTGGGWMASAKEQKTLSPSLLVASLERLALLVGDSTITSVPLHAWSKRISTSWAPRRYGRRRRPAGWPSSTVDVAPSLELRSPPRAEEHRPRGGYAGHRGARCSIAVVDLADLADLGPTSSADWAAIAEIDGPGSWGSSSSQRATVRGPDRTMVPQAAVGIAPEMGADIDVASLGVGDLDPGA